MKRLKKHLGDSGSKLFLQAIFFSIGKKESRRIGRKFLHDRFQKTFFLTRKKGEINAARKFGGKRD